VATEPTQRETWGLGTVRLTLLGHRLPFPAVPAQLHVWSLNTTRRQAPITSFAATSALRPFRCQSTTAAAESVENALSAATALKSITQNIFAEGDGAFREGIDASSVSAPRLFSLCTTVNRCQAFGPGRRWFQPSRGVPEGILTPVSATAQEGSRSLAVGRVQVPRFHC
jgi:hypothetical protein